MAMLNQISGYLAISDKSFINGCLSTPTKSEVMVHSDHSQYGSADYLAFMKEHNLVPSISRRGNCHDNAVAESFFTTIKKRIVKKKIYTTRNDAKAEIFNFIKMFSNPKKRHSHTGGISPAKFEEDYFSELKSA
ncbi:IS3 family transposase [Pseudoalteromonas denitrificans]|uniref:Integrase core domain-containing protein n=1 Tax=Pseudoalteromonas denitrificans DSM 6059 TaxID=1123010 RepID=A0A1I1UZV3_9GAMM|nr:IS3 family transposase [Pseudoalteromonas denitrificans]SFD76159.1 Integrase core domain-containing protein [Pseudoalteromonas denitrificans DSM 6059]